MNKVGFIVSIIAVSLLVSGMVVVQAHEDHNPICPIDRCDDFVSPTPKPSTTPSATPTPTIKVTPTATPSATPAPQGGTGVSDGFASDPGATMAFHPSCTIPFDPPVIIGFAEAGSGSATFSWLESAQDVSKFSIVYGYSPDAMIYGEDNIPSTSTAITISDLESGKNVFAQIYAWQQGCAELSNIFDPVVR